ncbi:MAG: hypothetical protein AABN33_27890 [Acidobacteriota bacterium]
MIANVKRFIGIAPLLCDQGLDEITSRCRRLAALKDYSELRNLSGRICNDLSSYYEAIADRTLGNPHLFFDLQVNDKYRPRIILTGGQSLLHSGSDIPIARQVIAESRRWARRQNDWLTVYQAARQAAIIESIDGNHRAALSTLRELFPLARLLVPRFAPLYYDYLNSLSVELMGVGQIEEAQRLASISASTPYVGAYPEWLDTVREISEAPRPRGRLSVLISRPLPENVVRLEPRNIESEVENLVSESIGTLLHFREPVIQMVNQRITEEEQNSIETRKQLRNRIVDALYERGEQIPEELLKKLLEKIEEIPLKRESS